MTISRALGLVALVLIAIVVAVLWIDMPLARALARFDMARALFRSKPLGLPILPGISLAVLFLGLAVMVAGRPLPRWLVAGSLAAVALLTSLYVTEDVLKPIFGRVVPSVALRGHVSGFHWLRSGSPYQSFPSGHSVQAASVVAVMWSFYPRLRLVMLAGFAVMAGALMLGQWHFLGDILAGGLVGALAGAAVVGTWRALSGVVARRQGRGPRSGKVRRDA